MSSYVLGVIPGFRTLSKQQMFDMAARHIGNTGVKSSASTSPSVCIYGGTGCNASVFIVPEDRERADRGISSWRSLVDLGLVPGHECEFIRDLQGAHDRTSVDPAKFKSSYLENMQQVAELNDLNTDILRIIEREWKDSEL